MGFKEKKSPQKTTLFIWTLSPLLDAVRLYIRAVKYCEAPGPDGLNCSKQCTCAEAVLPVARQQSTMAATR